MITLPPALRRAARSVLRRTLPRPPGPLVVLGSCLGIGLWLCLGVGACSDAGTAAAEEPALPRLLRVEVVGEVATLGERIRDSGFFRWVLPDLEGWRVEVEPPGSTSQEGTAAPDDSRVEVLVGLLPLPASVRQLAADLPVRLDGERVRFDGTLYARPGTSLILRFPGQPERWLVTGTDPEVVADAASRVMIRAVGGRFWGGDAARDADYVVRETPWLQRIGRWRPDGERWGVDPAAEHDDLAERERWFRGLQPLDAGGVRLLVEAGAAAGAQGPELRSLAEELGSAVERMRERLGEGGGPGGSGGSGVREPVTIAVERDFVSQARHTGAIGPAVEGGPADLHVVLDPKDRWAIRHALARWLIERAGLADGRPVWAVEGVAAWLSGGLTEDWYGRPFAAWVPDLVAVHALPTAGELLAPERTGDDSAPLWTPVAAAVAARLPGETAAAKLAAFTGLSVDAARDALAGLARRAGQEEAPSEARRAVALPAGFLRGVSFAMLNSLEGGYHAPGIGPRLEALERLGADSIALMPFAYQGDPRAPEMRFLNGSPTSETDVGVIHAARTAHARGLSVLWKPHIWVSHGSWPGEVEMSSEADWATWWRVYRRFILHHAVLARYAGADLFSVGVELERTVERPEWADLIADVRRIYHGPVTYAANWGGGADRAVFWDRLDAVGVDAYYPLAGAATGISDETLAEGARQVVERLARLARRTGKPVVLTEVGFAARRGTWASPHQEGGEASAADQARAYGALLGALAGPATAGRWLRGVYIWKAFSGDVSGRGDRADFRFMGRPAEAVVASFFRRRDVQESAR